MSASRSSLAPAALAALAALGCATRDVEPTPFALDVRLAGGGALADVSSGPELVIVSGTAHRVDATTLVLAGTQHGDLTFTFDRRAAPALEFPARLEGQAVSAEIFVDPEGKGPRGEPLVIPGYRLSTAGSYDFVLGEWTEETSTADPSLPPSFLQFQGGPTIDLPPLALVPEWSDWDPAECGLVYYLPLFALDGIETISLDRGARRDFLVLPRQERVTVLHVLTYQRRGECAGQSRSWSQIAAWR